MSRGSLGGQRHHETATRVKNPSSTADRNRHAGQNPTNAFKLWASRCRARYPEMIVTTCHNYEIAYKFRYQ
eukprot:3210693-Rhodomonas_salina.1